MNLDPTESNAELSRVALENDRLGADPVQESARFWASRAPASTRSRYAAQS